MSLRVLIVDDSPPFREAARAVLEARGYEVAGEADSARAAIDCARRLLPDAVLLDIDLPDGNGFGVCAGLMQCNPPPAVLLTSADDLRADPRVERSGAMGFLPKQQLARARLAEFWTGAEGPASVTEPAA
jgi:DNA-binding NarL/FixJ family response regulator